MYIIRCVLAVWLLLSAIYLFAQTPEQSQAVQWENLMKFDHQAGNYAKALEYNRKLLNECLEDSMFAATRMKNLIVTHCDLCYLLGTPLKMYDFLDEYISRLDKNNKFLYPNVFYTMIAEYRGNIRDFRYLDAIHHGNLRVDGRHAQQFFDMYKPAIENMNIFNKLYLKMTECDIYMLIGDYEKSRNILSNIAAEYDDVLSTDKKLSLYPMLQKEVVYAYEGKYTDAIQHAQQNLLYMEQNGMKNSSEYAAELSHMQLYLNKVGEHLESIKYGVRLRNPDFNSQRSVIPLMYQSNNSFSVNFKPAYYIQTKELLADSYLAIGDKEEAEQLMQEVFDFSLNGIYTAALQKEGYKNADMYLSQLIQYAPLYAWSLNTDKMACYLYNSALIFKQFSLHADKLVRNLVLQSSNQQLKTVYRKLQDTKSALDVADASVVDSLANRIAHLEAQIFNGVKRDNNILDGISTTWQQIKGALKPDEVAVEFVSFNPNEDETRFLACIVSTDLETPVVIELCSDIDLLTIEDIYTTNEAYDFVWKPLEQFLKDRSTIYFSPMGYLNNIAIEYLTIGPTNKTMNEQYNMFRLSSTREIIKEIYNPITRKNVLFGGIKYDLNEREREEQIENSKGSRTHILTEDEYDEYASLTRAGLSYLPGTKVEVETINEIIVANNESSILYMGTESTEEIFKDLPKMSPTLLHLATHGFYIPAETKSKLTKLYGYLNKRSSTEDISLGRSGLMLTGAVNTINEMNVGKSDCEDGILTAREISRLDFTSVDLVVLSACKTGLGDINSDGVYGLQRGLKKAGTNTIVMSLWKVDDEATKILMTEFYRNLYSNMTKHEAFTKAQNALKVVDNGKYDNPLYWAAFIMLDGKN